MGDAGRIEMVPLAPGRWCRHREPPLPLPLHELLNAAALLLQSGPGCERFDSGGVLVMVVEGLKLVVSEQGSV